MIGPRSQLGVIVSVLSTLQTRVLCRNFCQDSGARSPDAPTSSPLSSPRKLLSRRASSHFSGKLPVQSWRNCLIHRQVCIYRAPTILKSSCEPPTITNGHHDERKKQRQALLKRRLSSWKSNHREHPSSGIERQRRRAHAFRPCFAEGRYRRPHPPSLFTDSVHPARINRQGGGGD